MKHPSLIKRCVGSLALIASSLILAGCETITYYGQAAKGQMQIAMAQKPIEAMLKDETLDEKLREQLETVMAIRAFADESLKLDVGDSYAEFVDLGRPYVVWSVTAAPELSLTPERWCFPIAGCVTYRGYFSEDAANAKAAQLKAKGLDVYVRGVGAYSTLGWFDDPVLKSFLRRSEAGLAGLLFHEISHRELYLKGETTFNESFAVAVQIEGVKRWFENQGKPDLYDKYVEALERHDVVMSMLRRHRQQLEEAYSSNASDDQKRERKTQVIEAMRSEYENLKSQWPGYKSFDTWMAGNINNAKLSTLANYNDWVIAFRQLLRESDGELEVFYESCRDLTKLDKSDREDRLRELERRAG